MIILTFHTSTTPITLSDCQGYCTVYYKFRKGCPAKQPSSLQYNQHSISKITTALQIYIFLDVVYRHIHYDTNRVL